MGRRHIRIIAVVLAGIAAIAVPSFETQAQDASGFPAYMEQLRAQAAREGVSRATLDRVIPALTYNPRVVELDRQQPEGQANAPIPAFEPYKRKHVDSARITRGRAKYRELRPLVEKVERETGVPEEVMLAIYGHETNYGSFTGGFDIPRSLASLAYEGRRRDLFAGEFIAAMKMVDRGVSPQAMTGSWAGAMGKPQFLPSVYLRLARDGDGDGFADIWGSEPDALASIANYFVAAGWRKGEPWGFAVSVPAGLDRASLKSRQKSPRCPRVHERHSRWMTMKEWRDLGVVPTGRAWPGDDTMMASLIEPDGAGKTGYLLTGNYRVILDYNCSNFYALSVGLLADEIAR